MSEAAPIRLKVRYQSDRELLTEYTSSLTRGGCLLETPNPIPIGTQFIFEMQSDVNMPPTEMKGTVVRVTPRGQQFEVAVQYQSDEETRLSLEAVLSRVMVDPEREYVRRQPRIPVNLVCVEEASKSRYLIRDVSLGGMGFALPSGKELPAGVDMNTIITVTVRLTADARIHLRGHLAWMRPRTATKRAAFGVQFHKLNDSLRMVLHGMTHLMRPEGLAIRFDVGEHFDGERFPESSVSRAMLLDLPLVAMQSALATVSRLTGHTLTGKSSPSLTTSINPHEVSVCVGLTGALHGELWLRTGRAMATQLANSFLNDRVDHPEVIRDALRELLSAIAGQTGDTLEEHGYVIDVTPPIERHLDHAPVSGEQRFAYVLEGGTNTVEFMVVTRPPPPEYSLAGF